MSTLRRAVHRAILVGAGGAVGGVARMLVTVFVPVAAGAPEFAAPLLLAVNLSGSLFAGFLRGLLEREDRDGAWVDAFLFVGFCGGYTSYSGFIAMAPVSSPWIVAATLVLCPFAALVGMRLSGGYPARPAGSPR